jgi:hypothetical protein
MITDASVEMGQFIDDLLAFSRIGQVELHENLIGLDGLVQDTILGANAYVVQPVQFAEFVEAVTRVGAFWAILNEAPPASVAHPPRNAT